ncbi:MAG TPA: nickel-binding protein [Acidimicrobiales bacterium]|nr:nickel-binding protein [Acidimicrobiales bacterium]
MDGSGNHGHGDGRPHAFLVEHYWPDVTPDTFRAIAKRVRAAVDDMARSGASLRLLNSTFIPEDESAFCVFASSGQDLVEEAYQRAGVSFERILSVLEIETREPAEPPAMEN